MKKEMAQEEVLSFVKEVKSSHSQLSVAEAQFETAVTTKHSAAPQFVVQPRSQNVDEGQNVKFTCEIKGEPSPEVEWLKDNVMVSSLLQKLDLYSRQKCSHFSVIQNISTCAADVTHSTLSLQISVTSNIRLRSSEHVYTLEICEATVEDSGKYTIKARNQFGQCSATSSLNVLSKITLHFN